MAQNVKFRQIVICNKLKYFQIKTMRISSTPIKTLTNNLFKTNQSQLYSSNILTLSDRVSAEHVKKKQDLLSRPIYDNISVQRAISTPARPVTSPENVAWLQHDYCLPKKLSEYRLRHLSFI